jgi:hypothetical protein
MEIVLLWLGLSVLAGVAAYSRGRSFFGFLLLSLIFSPLIGLIGALVVSRDQVVIDARAVSGGSQRKCPFCAELIQPAAKVCKHCGRDLPAA